MRPAPSCMTFDMRAEYSVEIASSSKCRSSVNPIVSAKNCTHRSISPSSTLATTWSTAASPTSPGSGSEPPRGSNPGGERAVVTPPLDEPDHGVAVGADGRGPEHPVRVALFDQRRRAGGAAPARLREGVCGVGHLERHDRHPVAVRVGEPGRRVVGGEAAREDEPDRPAFQHVRGRLAASGLEAAVGGDTKPERVPVERGRLPGVSDVELDVVDATDGKTVSHDAVS